MGLFVKILHRAWDKLLIGFVSLLILLPASPLNTPIPNRDSGVFLYIGWRILNGEIPYRDIWDHKPPIIYYINALGLAMADGSSWGVWFIELASLFLAAYIGFILVKKTFGTLAAIFSMYLWLITLFFINQGGNFTTEYTLPLQFLCLWLAHEAQNREFCSWRGFLLGLLLGLAFMIKQNTIGIGLAVTIFLIVDRIRLNKFKHLLHELLTIFSGGALVILVLIILYAAQGALSQFWDAAFIYNFVYSSTDLMAKINGTISGMSPLYRTGLPQLALIGYVISIIWLIFKRDFDRKWFQLIVIGLIDLPIELALVNVSARSYPHYFMILLPIFSVFAGYTVWLIFSVLDELLHLNIPKIIGTLCVCAVLLMYSMVLYKPYMDVIRNDFGLNQDNTMISYISKLTSPTDTVLMWGAETTTNFFSQRRSPSRFVYQYPLYMIGYSNEKIINEFIQDIIRHKPKFIIDTKNKRCPIFNFPIESHKIDAGIANIKSHYRIKEDIRSWTVYEYIDI